MWNVGYCGNIFEVRDNDRGRVKYKGRGVVERLEVYTILLKALKTNAKNLTACIVVNVIMWGLEYRTSSEFG